LDIKSKKYNFLPFIKAVLFIITVACFSASVTLLAHFEMSNKYGNSIWFEENYYDSRNFISETIGFIQLFQEYQENTNQNEADSVSEEPVTDADQLNLLKNRLANKQYDGIKYNYSDKIFNDNLDALDTESFEGYPAYILIDSTSVKTYPGDYWDKLYNYYVFDKTMENLDEGFIYIGFEDVFLNSRIEAWDQQKSLSNKVLYSVLGLLGSCILLFVILILLNGKKTLKDKNIHMGFWDGIYNDINLIICIILSILWFALAMNIFHNFYLPAFIFAETFIFAALVLGLVLSLIKHIKNKTLIQHTLTFTLLNKVYRLLKDIYLQSSTGKKIIGVLIGYSFLLLLEVFIFLVSFHSFPFVLLLIPITIALALRFTLTRVRDYDVIRTGILEVKEGNYDYRINISGKGELKNLAEDINSISQGFSQAIKNKLKSERLKTELITNVSHDIRTPLTSIITYVDLLRKETDSDKKEEYIEVIDHKSQRLKTLTEDLFEASKASSGNINVHWEKIDIVSLITQGLGELHEKIEEKGYDFKVNYPEERLFVHADGKLLWRVIENLLSNILKYSLTGSRVYIDVIDKDDMVAVSFKNISEHELNIPVDELLERFTRGDESRNSEGSGLGLSIAKSLTEVQKGKFSLNIDGDLFKTIIQVPKYKN